MSDLSRPSSSPYRVKESSVLLANIQLTVAKRHQCLRESACVRLSVLFVIILPSNRPCPYGSQ